MQRLGLIGFGRFGQFIAPYLTPHFEVLAYDIAEIASLAADMGSRAVPLDEAAACEIVVLAIPVQNMEQTLREIADKVQPGALVLDVASVKVRPLALMRQYLPESVEVIGLHPMFGPESGKNGIAGMSVALCPGESARVDFIRTFLHEALGLNVLDISAEEHDRQMAYVQALPHFISWVLNRMHVPPTDLETPAYHSMLRVRELLRNDTEALMRTIENENPFAGPLREQFLLTAREVEDWLRQPPE